MNTEHDPRVFCQPLAAYNDGIICGRWLEAAVEEDELWEGVNDTLAHSPIINEEEFMWADHEGFESVRIYEYETVRNVTRIARGIKEHGEAFAVWYGLDSREDVDDLSESFLEAYIGEFEDEDELGEHMLESMGLKEVLDAVCAQYPQLALYITADKEQLLVDLDCGGDVYVHRKSNGHLLAYWMNT